MVGCYLLHIANYIRVYGISTIVVLHFNLRWMGNTGFGTLDEGLSKMKCQVASATKKGRYYEVKYSNGGGWCTCPSFRYTGWCKHLEKFKQRDRDLKESMEELVC